MYVCVTSKESSQKILPPSTVESEVNRTPMNVNCYYSAFPGCRRVDEYKRLSRTGERTYDVVFRAQDINTRLTETN